MENMSLEKLTSAQKLILWSVQVDKKRDLHPFVNVVSDLDWSKVRFLAIFHGIFPLLYSRLKKLAKNHLSEQEMNQLKMIHLRGAGQNLILVQHLFQILDLFSKKGIETVSYKGPVLALRAYGDISRRHYVDLDFLVKKKDFPLLYQELTASGYKPLLPLTKRMVSLWSRSGREFIFVKDKIYVDIHMRISEGPAIFKINHALWNDCTAIQMDAHQVPALSVEDSLLILSIHGTKHCWVSLKWIADIAHMVFSHPEIKWDRLLIKARKIGCLSILGIGLRLAQKICGLTLSAELEKKVLGNPKIEKLTTQFYWQIFSEEFVVKKIKKRLLPVKSLDSFLFKLRYIGYYIFTPKFKDLKTFPLPSILYPCFYLLRPIRLFFSIWPILFKSLFKR
jgi:hypothetical protein